MDVEVLPVPENSIIVLRNFHADGEWLERFAESLRASIGHDRYLVCYLDTEPGGDLLVRGVEPDVLDLIRTALEGQ